MKFSNFTILVLCCIISSFWSVGVKDVCEKCQICKQKFKYKDHVNLCFLSKFGYFKDYRLGQHTMNCVLGRYSLGDQEERCKGVAISLEYEHFLKIKRKKSDSETGKAVLSVIKETTYLSVKSMNSEKVWESLGNQHRSIERLVEREIENKPGFTPEKYPNFTPATAIVYTIDTDSLFFCCSFDFEKKKDVNELTIRQIDNRKNNVREYTDRIMSYTETSVYDGVDEFIVKVIDAEKKEFRVDEVEFRGEYEYITDRERLIKHIAGCDYIVQSANQYKEWHRQGGEVIDGNKFSKIRKEITESVKLETFLIENKSSDKFVGAYFDLEEAIMLVRDAYENQNLLQKSYMSCENTKSEKCELGVKIGFDGTRFSPTIMNLFVTIQMLNVYNNVQSTFNTFLIASKNVKKETEETMLQFLEDIDLNGQWKKIDGKIVNAGMDGEYVIRPFLSCDMKDMYIIMGIGNPTAQRPYNEGDGCWLCGWEDVDPMYIKSFEWLKDYYENNENKALPDIPFDQIIPDGLHIVMNMVRKIICTLYNWARNIDKDEEIKSVQVKSRQKENLQR